MRSSLLKIFNVLEPSSIENLVLIDQAGISPAAAQEVACKKWHAEGRNRFERDDKKTIPPCVYYSLSSYGRTLAPVVEMIFNWGRSHLKRLAARR